MHIRSPEQFNVFQVKRIIEQLSPQRSFHVLVERLSSANKVAQQAGRHKRVLHETHSRNFSGFVKEVLDGKGNSCVCALMLFLP